MTDYARVALPGRWLALPALLARLSRCGERVVRFGSSPERDANPTTMQTIERASAHYQEKLGFSTLFFAGEFRRLC